MINKKYSIQSINSKNKYYRDQYAYQAKKKGLRSRAWFKLSEIHMREKLFFPGMIVIDLGACPGGWTKYVTTQVGNKGKVLACDIAPMDPIENTYFIQGDFNQSFAIGVLLKRLNRKKANVVLSDMSPNISGISIIDMPKSIQLMESALRICKNILVKNGSFLVKAFYGDGFNEYLNKLKMLFVHVKVLKPNSSRSFSKETYILAKQIKL